MWYILVKRINCICNEVVQNLRGAKLILDERVEESIHRWYGYIVKVDEARVIKNVWQSELRGNKLCGRQRRKLNDCVKNDVGKQAVSNNLAHDREAWGAFVKSGGC